MFTVQRPNFVQIPSHKLNIAESLAESTTAVLDSPEPMFFSAPSSPLTEYPLEPILLNNLQESPDEAFPEPVDIPAEFDLDDQGLTTLDKIYLFSRSPATFHRVYIAHAMPKLLRDVTPGDAVEYVLPLLTVLALDDDEQVKEAFVSELVPIIWWFFSNCQLVPVDVERSKDDPPTICVDTFTPILGTLLLSRNSLVNGPARYAVVDLLQRMRRADQLEDTYHPEQIDRDSELDLPSGLFGRHERALLESEILSQVVIGMGRLDVEPDDDSDDSDDVFFTPAIIDDSQLAASYISPAGSPSVVSTSSTYGNVNPYFPVLPSSTDKLSYSSTSLASSSGSERSTPSSTTSTTASDSSSASSLESFYSSNSTLTSSKQDKGTSPTPTPSVDIIITSPPSPSSGPTSPFASGQSLDNFSSRNTFHTTFLEWSPLTLTVPTQSKGTSSPLEPFVPSNHATASFNIESPRHRADQLPAHISVPIPVHGPRREPSPAQSDRTEYPHDSDTQFFSEHDSEADKEQAAVGRLSSMSLMAAVTASGCLNETMKQTFAEEVERVAKDPIYWVRREACFALGALAKVVPQEVVMLSLVPILQNLLHDPTQEVRSSSLFALPAILSRLPFRRQKKLALDTFLPMSMDESAEVRQRMLEALGEVIYTFHNKETAEEEDEGGGPPEALVKMFLGKRLAIPGAKQEKQEALELFYTDPSWPLVCAFNFPAVALVLGRSRWKVDLRETYLSLAANPASAVRRSLAASVGEMAKIIGPQNSGEDLLPFWLEAIASDEEDVRLKALECLEVFCSALISARRAAALEGLLRSCEGGVLKSWRERELVARSLKGIVQLAEDSEQILGWVRRVVRFVLQDNVSAVREAGVIALPAIWIAFKRHEGLLDSLQADVTSLAQSHTFRRRMTFIACQQSLILPGPDGASVIEPDDIFWESLANVANDAIIDVRIGLARLVGLALHSLSTEGKVISGILLNLSRQLSQDASKEVRSYVPKTLTQMGTSSDLNGRTPVSTFSRPPIVKAGPSSDIQRPWKQ